MNEPNGKRMLVVLEAGEAYPSGYLRAMIYKDYFERAGFKTDYVNRLHPRLARLVGFPSSWLAFTVRPIVRRLLEALGVISEKIIARKARNYDVVYMSKVTTLGFIKQLRRTDARLVLDFGDAVWLPGRAGADFDDILRAVDAVTTDNELTAKYASRFNSECTVIPDCPQIEWFDQRRAQRRSKDDSIITIGWVGSPGTAYNLFVVWEALERLFAKYPNLRLRLLGIGSNRDYLPRFEKVQYSGRASYTQSEMIDEVLGMDIGLFPLQDTEASRVRGVLKATVYMAGQAVAICSPVGQCRDLIQDGVNGMLADGTDEWERKIEQLILNPALRKQIANAGLETVRNQFTVEQSFEKLRHVLVDGRNGRVKIQ